MKFLTITAACLLPAITSGFTLKQPGRSVTPDATHSDVGTVNRNDFLKTASIAAVGLLSFQEPVFATGRATLEQSYERYAPRIKAGGDFYQGDFKQMVAKADWAGIKEATGGVPPRQKEDLSVRYLQ